MFSKEVGIDLEMTNLLMYVEGEGIAIDKPSVVAMDIGAKKCLVAGQNTKDILGRTPGRVLTIHLLKDGVIANLEITEIILGFFFKKLVIKGMFKCPTTLICRPSNITSVERNAIRDAAYRVGTKKAYIGEEPKVAAVGAGLDIGKPSGYMVLDIGGGMTDVVVISLGGIVSNISLKTTEDMLDRGTIRFVKENRKLLVGNRTVEEVKKQIETTWKGSIHETVKVSGRDLVTGLLTTTTLSSEEIQGSVAGSLQGVVRARKTVLEQTPPELASDIMIRDIVLTDSGALLYGINELLRNKLHILVYVVEDALRCVAEDTGVLLENLHLVQ